MGESDIWKGWSRGCIIQMSIIDHILNKYDMLFHTYLKMVILSWKCSGNYYFLGCGNHDVVNHLLAFSLWSQPVINLLLSFPSGMATKVRHNCDANMNSVGSNTSYMMNPYQVAGSPSRSVASPAGNRKTSGLNRNGSGEPKKSNVLSVGLFYPLAIYY